MQPRPFCFTEAAVFSAIRLRPVLIALLALIFLDGSSIASATTPTPKAPKKAEGLILFYSDRSGNKDIWVIKPDGTGLSQLTHDPDDDLLPSWSPDGKRIVFTSMRDGDNGIYTMNVNGTNQKRLVKDHGGSPI